MIIRWELSLGLILVLISIAIARKDLSSGVDYKCPVLAECPYRADLCTDDDDCAPDSICCKSPCGKVCTKQLFTGCHTLQRAASRVAKSLGDDSKNVRIPRCNKSGGFESIQCDNEIVSSCWCVDDAGFEIPGTRAPAEALVNCTATKPCADYTCRMFCPYGFSLTKEGCPLCRCRDPCDDIRCPNALECHLEELACSDPPCPPIPTCKKGRSLDNICPLGDPLRISDTVRPFLCGNDPGKPTCPPMYQCLVQKGNDYGVCCPASLKIKKTGDCPAVDRENLICGPMCSHDLECPSVQKCCETEQCGFACVHPKNMTECYHQRSLSELLTISERRGRGYIPQCTSEGEFEKKQCSRNGLVCWCVDRLGIKLKGSMGPSHKVNCSLYDTREVSMARSLGRNGKECEPLECAAVCEYGFKLDENACPTCKCDDPCEGYICEDDEECVNVKESSCSDFLCPTLPVCRPKAVYDNPCEKGTPLTDDLSGAPLTCTLRSRDGNTCPRDFVCTAVPGSVKAVCCPLPEFDELQAEASEDSSVSDDRQTMCEYLHNFSESMEGTRDGMKLALPSPQCDEEGDFLATQCHNGECWCVDYHGTEIPKTRAKGNSTDDCDKLRSSMDCLDATCRIGCDYGFMLSEETGCPLCQCRDPCSSVTCGENELCQIVEVSCANLYCPPVPACLPKKIGQCPYLMPTTTTSCEFQCNSDMVCNGTERCCSDGCGTQCMQPLMFKACQHEHLVALHQAHEAGIPASKMFIPQCKEDGSFASKQCDPGKGECWCVDFRGFEISETRVSSANNLSCDPLPRSKSCPLLNCVKDCEHGFEINEHGCRTCTCIDPCSKITCRGEGETCRLVEVECVDDPFCRSVPICLPKKENPCQTGEPLKLGSSDELVTCGPDYASCPSSHKCQLSPIGEYAVCCPKPRDVCFENMDKGFCNDDEPKNLTRYYFNYRTNRCESFVFSGCGGNHNNFYSEDMCQRVCPVLSKCERLREKNQKAAERYNKPTFMPRCDASTGAWLPVQCLEHVGVCWCVSPQGEPLKGTLTRGNEPECNFRQARIWANDRSDVISDEDLVLEELMMQLGSFDEDDEPEDDEMDDPMNSWEQPVKTRCQALGGQCDDKGKFLPMQCDDGFCWCVDEAGNQLANSITFQKGKQICLFTPVEKVEIILGFRGEYDDISVIPVINKIKKVIENLKGIINNDRIRSEITDGIAFVKFSLIGSNKVDVAYRLEQLVIQQRIPGLIADITRSRITHRLFIQPTMVDQVASMEHREIVSQSPVSVIAPYHTALIVIAAASAFVISVLTLLVILYRRKMQNLSSKETVDDSRFLGNRRPIYIELPNEKYSSLASVSTTTEQNP